MVAVVADVGGPPEEPFPTLAFLVLVALMTAVILWLFRRALRPAVWLNERDAIQKKTFTKWVNKHLKKAACGAGRLTSLTSPAPHKTTSSSFLLACSIKLPLAAVPSPVVMPILVSAESSM
ncbi:hypothetical protein ONE63_004574 [Megalurothrips usitatus]|uniref:Uncharacterized protein n=1 Tax=Megalurothrips usitatus TaxID=439358 RepID=A0AAV7X2P0_9NEOP|nr:hypothetical protein ONE63_004574 [Megalurothrips usitatus]